jgi:hypothetical protein
MKKTSLVLLSAISAFVATPATAAPGLGSKVYGATLEAGETELEARYGRLTGGADAGEDGLVLEAAHSFSPRSYAAVLGEFEREPGGGRKLEAFSIEAIRTLGRIGGLDTAIYGEYEVGLHGPDKLETKLLVQKRAGPLDARINLIAEHELVRGAPLDFGYAASVDVAAIGKIRLGAAAFGDLGSSRNFTTRAQHFAGPIVKAEIEHIGPGELEIETGYLFALGRARDDAKGQLRLNLEYAFHF